MLSEFRICIRQLPKISEMSQQISINYFSTSREKYRLSSYSCSLKATDTFLSVSLHQTVAVKWIKLSVNIMTISVFY